MIPPLGPFFEIGNVRFLKNIEFRGSILRRKAQWDMVRNIVFEKEFITLLPLLLTMIKLLFLTLLRH